MKEVIYVYQRFGNWYMWRVEIPEYLEEKKEIKKREMTNKIIILWVYQRVIKSE